MDPTSLRPHRGVLILVLGILGVSACIPLGPVAWVMGGSDLRAMAEGRMDPSGRDLTQAGRICGIFGTLLLGVSAGWMLVALAAMVAMA